MSVVNRGMNNDEPYHFFSTLEITEDPTCIITYKNPVGITIFYNIPSNEQWIIWGRCNQCGLCELGRVDDYVISWHDEPGNPFACEDLIYSYRKGIPIRPELPEKMKCSYRGAYL